MGVIYFIAMLALWLLWVAPVSPHDFEVGIGAAAAAEIISRMACSQNPPRFFPRASWGMELLKAPKAILSDTGRVISHLVLQLLGRRQPLTHWYWMPFHSGQSHQAPARRAVAIAISTLSPNSITIDIDPKKNETLVHQLHAGPRPDALARMGQP